jgi:hypothetical protein
MHGQLNPKIVGATIIGFALVAGAFTISSLTSDKTTTLQPAALVASTPARSPITVSDKDDNGIEDWRDEFVTSAPVILNTASSTYNTPDTLTGQMSISFMENIIRSRNYGPFGRSQDEVIADTVNTLVRETEAELYDTPDITIMEQWEDQDILNYANTVASTIYLHNVSGLEGELVILHDILTTNNPERLTELRTIATTYQNYRDDTLKIPVPAFLIKEHLDLINTYQAIYTDITAMTIVFEDPAVSLLRVKRYQDDATGLSYALQNMFLALEPYAHLVGANDPALFFGYFSPDINL